MGNLCAGAKNAQPEQNKKAADIGKLSSNELTNAAKKPAPTPAPVAKKPNLIQQ